MGRAADAGMTEKVTKSARKLQPCNLRWPPCPPPGPPGPPVVRRLVAGVAAAGLALGLAGASRAASGDEPATQQRAPERTPGDGTRLGEEQTSDGRPGTRARPLSAARLAATRRISAEAGWTVVPGLEYRQWDETDARGTIRAYLLTADLATAGLTLDYTSGRLVRHRAPLTSLLARDDAVAGVNGDFFDISDTGAPLGVGRDRQIGMRHGPAEGWNRAFWIADDGTTHIGTLPMVARVEGRPGIRVTNVNSPRVRPGGIGVYTGPGWGRTLAYRVTDGQRRRVRQVVVRAGVVRSTSRRLSRGARIRGLVLVGRGRGADTLRRLRPGTPARLTWGLEGAPAVAIGGNAVLLAGGAVRARDDVALHPRTAIGVDRDTGQVLLLVIDGRQDHSRGYTMRELARMMRRLGAEDALNLDGGGSSTLVAADRRGVVGVRNSPSDGRQRAVPNGLGFTYEAPPGLRQPLDHPGDHPVPERPLVLAPGELTGHLGTGGPRCLDEPAVRLDQPVPGAARDVQGRERGDVGSLEHPERVQLVRRLAVEHPSDQRVPLVAPGEQAEVHGSGQAGRRPVPLRMAQRQLQGAVPSHRQPGDIGPGGVAGHPEEAVHELGELVCDVAPVRVPVDLVGVEAASRRGHHDRQPGRRGIPLDRGVSGPRGVVVGQPVQQIQHRRLTESGSAVDPDLRLGRLGQHHGDRGPDLEGLGEEAARDQRHGA